MARVRSIDATRLLGLLLLFGPACGRQERHAPPLELLSFRQAGRENVALNERLAFHFSEALDRSSVTAQSVSVRDADGGPAQGHFSVEGSRLVFAPDLPLAADLSDGGLRPATGYTVELAGFPWPDGLRGERGSLLSATLRLEFRTAAPGGEAPLFLETFSDRPFPLIVVGHDLGPLDPILLECGEALDPGSLRPDEFELLPLNPGANPEAEPERIPLRVRLVSNEENRARVELRPAGSSPGGSGVLEPGLYFLRKAGTELRNLSGRAVSAAWPLFTRLEVRARGVGTETLTFRHASRRWHAEPPGLDGTASWPAGDEGGVGVRFPAAAGDGRDGPVELVELDGRQDVHATRLEVPGEADVDLSGIQGLVVLRSQGPLVVRGALRRRVPGAPDRTLAEAFLRASHAPPEGWETLGAWLERARASGEPWTVLVAGGDLRVPGRIEVDGPLLLVAGGWIRIAGRVEAEEVWKTPEGGQNVQARLRLGDAPLVLESPDENPLRKPLRVGVTSVPIRPPRGVVSWSAATVRAHPGTGSYDVRYLGLRDGPAGVEEFGPVGDLALLEGCDAVRLFFVLEVPAGRGEAWDPPRVESVELSWTEPPPQSDEGPRSVP